MKSNSIPHFEAYVSIDIPNPLNATIYDLRDTLSDKKMVVMPVDVPLFGHFDNTMCLIRNKNQLDKLMDKAVERFRTHGLNPEDHPLITRGFKATDQGGLLLEFEENVLLDKLLVCILETAKEMEETCITEVVESIENRPYMYVIQKSHVATDRIQAYENTKLDIEVPLSRLTFYHKEAVPLTRIQSWNLVED